MRITVYPDGRVVVTKPQRTSSKNIEEFVRKYETWITERRAKLLKRAPLIALPRPRKNSKAYKEARAAARELVTRRLEHFNREYGYTYGTISIRDQKTRWGSCSAKGNLSFNYRIVFLPSELADYLVVHELCHLKEHNHSKRYWELVERAVPDYKKLGAQIRKGYSL